MEKPRISAIAAIGKNRELGKNNDLIWKFKADFERMKTLIKGHTLVMGRSTYESIGRELSSPCVVITSDQNYQSPYQDAKHTFVTHSLEEALAKAREIESVNSNDEAEVFIFGGQRVYSDALPQTERLYLTEINAADPEADVFFPDYSEFSTTLESAKCEEGGVSFRLLTLEH